MVGCAAVSRRSTVPLARRHAPVAAGVPPAIAQLSGLGVLAAVILVHEAGHFSAARSLGIRVKEFSVGFGPTLLSRAASAPELPRYSLRLLPVGGYVSFPRYINATRLEANGVTIQGKLADDVRIARDDPDLLENRPRPQQALVVSAGVAFNLLLAWSCFFSTASVVGIPTIVEQQAKHGVQQ